MYTFFFFNFTNYNNKLKVDAQRKVHFFHDGLKESEVKIIIERVGLGGINHSNYMQIKAMITKGYGSSKSMSAKSRLMFRVIKCN